MFKILQKTISTGIVTTTYPWEQAKIVERFRGARASTSRKWRDARPAAEVCPTGAISCKDGALRCEK